MKLGNGWWLGISGPIQKQYSRWKKILKKDYLAKAKQIYSYLIEDQSLVIGRIGFVVDFIVRLTESSNKKLQNQLLKENCYFAKSEKIKGISLIFTEKDDIDSSWEINRLIKIDSLRKISEPENDKRLALRCDINTIPEKINEYNLTVENIEKILYEASKEMTDDNLNKFLNEKYDE